MTYSPLPRHGPELRDLVTPSLSVCMLTAEPAERVEAIVAPLREIADEIVVAVDARLAPDAVGRYLELADAVYRIEVRMIERCLGWVHAQCHGDWILKLDADEVPSSAFLERLPELIADPGVMQYWVARAWLYPDAEHLLGGRPWSVDFNNRLVRTGLGLSFPGGQHEHAAAAYPAAYVAEPVYHLVLLLEDEAARRAKVVRCEVARPHLRALGGQGLNEAFYLPELRPKLKTHEVPAVDRGTIARVLDAVAGSQHSGSAVDLPIVPREEVERHWPGRAYPATPYAARIEPHSPGASIALAASDTVFV